MSTTDPSFVEVYRAGNMQEAYTIQAALEEAGLRVHVDGDMLQGAIGGIAAGWATAPRILVEESEIDRALEIIEAASIRAHDNSDDATSHCLACNHVMSESVKKCPACGWSYLVTDIQVLPRPAEEVARAAAGAETARASGPSSSRGVRWLLLIFALLAILFALLYWNRKAAEADFQRGVAALEQKDHDLAIARFTDALRRQPRNAQAYYNRGIAHYATGNFDAAIADCDEVIRLGKAAFSSDE